MTERQKRRPCGGRRLEREKGFEPSVKPTFASELGLAVVDTATLSDQTARLPINA